MALKVWMKMDSSRDQATVYKAIREQRHHNIHDMSEEGTVEEKKQERQFHVIKTTKMVNITSELFGFMIWNQYFI